MRRVPLGVLISALLALALAGCGGSGKSTPAAASGPDPASLAPADAAVYGEVLVRPSGDVKGGVETAARKVTRMPNPFGELVKAIDKSSADDGEAATYAKDIEPWLGERAGVFVLLPASAHDDPDVGIIVAARDRQALEREFERMRSDGDLKPGGTYRGVEYGRDKQDDSPTAVVGEFLVVGTTMHALQVAIDTSKKGSSLAGSSRYQDALGALTPDHLAFAYADPQQIATQVHAMRGVPAQVQRVLDALHLTDGPPVTLDLTARSDEIALQLSGGSKLLRDAGADGSGPGLTVGELPGDAWLAFATPPLGPIIRQAIEQAGVHDEAAAQVREATGLDLDADLLDPLGALAGFARGTGPLDIGGGIVLRMRDAESAQKLLNRLQAIATAASGGSINSLSGGFEVLIPGSPQPIVVQVKGDRIAVGYAASSAKDLLDPQQRFDESSAGRAAIATLGEGYTPSLVLIAPPVVELLRSLDDIEVADFSSVLPYLGAYRSLAVGTRHDGDRTTVRVVVALR